MRGGKLSESDEAPMPGDPPEYIAEKILEAIENGKSEIFAHEWMGKPRK
jgi:hypothetical protein